MTDSTQAASAPSDGLDRIREWGLTKHQLVDEETGAVCVRGALVAATSQTQCGRYSWTGRFSAALRFLADAATEQFPDRIPLCDRSDPHLVVVAVNDHPFTTAEDIERLFEKAIVRAYGAVD